MSSELRHLTRISGHWRSPASWWRLLPGAALVWWFSFAADVTCQPRLGAEEFTLVEKMFLKGDTLGVLNLISRGDHDLNLSEPRDRARLHFGLYFAYLHAEAYESAMAHLDFGLLLDSTNAEMWWRKGRTLFLLDDMRGALQCAERSVALDNEYGRAWSDLGLYHLYFCSFENAIDAYQAAFSVISPSDSTEWKSILGALGQMRNAGPEQAELVQRTALFIQSMFLEHAIMSTVDTTTCDMLDELYQLRIHAFDLPHPVRMASMSAYVQCLIMRGYRDSARSVLDASTEWILQISDLDDSTKQQLIRLHAMQYEDLGDYGKAVRLYEAAIRTGLTSGQGQSEPTLISKSYFAAGLARLGLEDSALQVYADLIMEVQGLPEFDIRSRVRLLAQAGACAQSGDDLRRARQYLEEGRILYLRHQLNEPPLWADLQRNLARLAQELGDFETALKIYLEVQAQGALSFPIGHPELLLATQDVAMTQQDLGRFDEAERMQRAVVGGLHRVYRLIHPDLANAILNLAGMLKDQGKYSESELLYLEALGMYRSLYPDDHPSRLLCMNNVASFYQDLGRYEAAEEIYREILRVVPADRRRNASLRLVVLNNLAGCCRSVGAYERARPLLEEVLDARRAACEGDDRNLALSLNNLGILYDELGWCDTARTLREQSVQMYRRLYPSQHPDLAVAINNLAGFYSAHGDRQKALPLFRESARMLSSAYPNGHLELVRVLWNLGDCLEYTDEVSEALDQYSTSILMLNGIIQKTIGTLSEREMEQFHAIVKRYFDMFCSVAIRHSRRYPRLLPLMQEFHFQVKGLYFDRIRELRKHTSDTKDPGIIDLFERWKNTRGEASRLFLAYSISPPNRPAALDSLFHLSERLEGELARRVGFSFSPALGADYTSLQRSLGSGEAALDFTRFQYFGEDWTDSVLYVALLTRFDDQDTPQLIILNDAKLLEGNGIGLYRQACSESYQQNQDVEKKLFELFWEPIEEQLDGIAAVFLSTDGIYGAVNIGTLSHPEGRFLSERLNIRYVTNLNLLGKVEEISQEQSTRPVVLIGDPDYACPDGAVEPDLSGNRESEKVRAFAPLPGTGKEIHAIQELLASYDKPVDAYTGTDARENTLKSLRAPSALLISTHGFIETPPSVPRRSGVHGSTFDNTAETIDPLLLSGLALAGANCCGEVSAPWRTVQDVDDGLLTAFEAAQLDLVGTDLVVLSACETGRGKIVAGEGVYSLQRAFHIAGADVVLMSLWKVPDQQTSELMILFFRQWLQGEDAPSALKAAQAELRKRYPQPYYWGAFVAISSRM